MFFSGLFHEERCHKGKRIELQIGDHMVSVVSDLRNSHEKKERQPVPAPSLRYSSYSTKNWKYSLEYRYSFMKICGRIELYLVTSQPSWAVQYLEIYAGWPFPWKSTGFTGFYQFRSIPLSFITGCRRMKDCTHTYSRAVAVARWQSRRSMISLMRRAPACK